MRCCYKDWVNRIVYGLVAVLLILLFPRWVWFVILFGLLGLLGFVCVKMKLFDRFFKF